MGRGFCGQGWQDFCRLAFARCENRCEKTRPYGPNSLKFSVNIRGLKTFVFSEGTMPFETQSVQSVPKIR